MNSQDLISGTAALCLLIAAAGGFGGAFYVCQARAVDCLEGWKAAGAGALAAAGLSGTLLARLPSNKPFPEDPEQMLGRTRRRYSDAIPEEPGDPPQGDGGRG